MKKTGKIALIIRRAIIICVVLIIVIICTILSLRTIFSSLDESSLFFGGLSNMPLIYERNDGLYINKIGEDKSFQLSHSLCSKSQFSNDRKRIFLLCENTLEYINFNELNFDDIKSSKTKIDSDVDDFICDRDGRFVVYKKGHSLYYAKPGKKPKLLSNNVFGIPYINEADGNIVYTKYNSDLYVYNINKNKTVKTKNISYYKFKNDDSQKLYYLKSGILYYRDKSNTPVYITNNVSNIISVDSGLFAVSKNENLYSIYKINGTKLSLVDENISEISDDFGTYLIYKKNTEDGFETYCLNRGGKTFELFDKNSSASNYTITPNGKYVFAVIEYMDNPDILVKYSLTLNGVSDREIITDNISDYSLLENGAIIYTDSEGTYLYENNKHILLSKYKVFETVCIDDSIYISESADGENFNILRLKNGSVQFLAENTSGTFDALTSSAISYVKDDELYFKHGTQEASLINNNVKHLLKTTKYN